MNLDITGILELLEANIRKNLNCKIHYATFNSKIFYE